MYTEKQIEDTQKTCSFSIHVDRIVRCWTCSMAFDVLLTIFVSIKVYTEVPEYILNWQCLYLLLFLYFQILWTFSIYLESVAILPQLFMISKTGEAESITSHYLFCLGIYRALYLFNWVYRYYFEGYFDLIAVVAGCVQTILYCDFFYLYITKGKSC